MGRQRWLHSTWGSSSLLTRDVDDNQSIRFRCCVNSNRIVDTELATSHYARVQSHYAQPWDYGSRQLQPIIYTTVCLKSSRLAFQISLLTSGFDTMKFSLRAIASFARKHCDDVRACVLGPRTCVIHKSHGFILRGFIVQRICVFAVRNERGEMFSWC